MQIIETQLLDDRQKMALLHLWNNEYPVQIAYHGIADLQAYLDKLEAPVHYLAARGEYIAGWACTFDRDGERWFAIIVDGGAQGAGIGTLLLRYLQSMETALNGWAADHERDIKANGDTYRSPLEFYRKMGFMIMENARLETDKLSLVKIKWIRIE